MDEQECLLTSQNNAQHFEYANQSSDIPAAFYDTALSETSTTLNHAEKRGATVFQTSLNIAKLCMGTGTLALPFAAQKGGLVFNMIGLGVIVVWNYYSADCLLKCLDHLPRDITEGDGGCPDRNSTEETYGTIEVVSCARNRDSMNIKVPGPPEGTTTYGIVAWHAFGNAGLMILDLLMIMLFVGLLIAYEAAMISFMDGINMSTGFSRWDKILPGIIVAVLSCAKDISFLSQFSAVGLIALAVSFGVISCEGVKENGLVDRSEILQLNQWPESLSAASSWFGVVVFGYGVTPVIFNIQESMAKPQFVGKSTIIGLGIAYVGYLFASNGIRILFARTHSFDGDVLQALPDSLIALAVRLLMTFVVAVTAPFIVVPCGEMIEGKMGLDSDCLRNRVAVRTLLCSSCTLLAAFVPGFVHIISFVGCFCVSMTGFVYPPLFSLSLKTLRCDKQQKHYLGDVGLLLLGLMTTGITSVMTFRDLVNYSTIKIPDETYNT